MPSLTKKAVKALNQKLQLPFTGQEQNWAMELADADRISEFIALYQRDPSLDQAQKQALVALTVASCDKALQEGKPINLGDWKQIQASLYTDPENRNLLAYWALPGVEDVSQHFHLTPYIRSPA